MDKESSDLHGFRRYKDFSSHRKIPVFFRIAFDNSGSARFKATVFLFFSALQSFWSNALRVGIFKDPWPFPLMVFRLAVGHNDRPIF